MQYILTRREADEPVIVRSPYVLFGASYYARGMRRPLLCVWEPQSEFKHGSVHLRDDDFIASDELTRLNVFGAWLLNTDSYEDPERFLCPLPSTWELTGKAEFEQDYLWERPVLVQHYRTRQQTD